MRWDESHESPDIIDRRGQEPMRGGADIGGLLFLLPWLLRTRIGWVLIAGGILFYFARGALSGGLVGQNVHGGAGSPSAPGEEAKAHFVAFVLDDVQSTWSTVFRQMGRPYRHAKLVLYEDATETACGYGEAATGPFYCPSDERVYIDLGFFRELSGRLGAQGQFAQAYVVAHELGHHVQKLLAGRDGAPAVGLSRHDDSMRPTKGASGTSVRLELQADCYAGIWAKSTEQRNLLDAGDVASAIGAAQAVGDDRLQRMGHGRVNPESWTHGSSDERARWFRRGLTSGSLEACDTFGVSQL
ncbi:MAG TPA: neutral zinc metallopeptidase [Polyangiaceae bacterium]|nr:neutral zinc metallopeptidase [Polyangiaceae bacterium]